MYFLPGVCLRFLLRNFRQHWESMAGRGRKKDQPTAVDTQELSEGGEAERSFLELFMASQAKRDEEVVERARQEQMAAEARAKQERIETEERAEQRRLRAEIAAEEREEKRREREEERRVKARLDEEERLEARALEKERRKREEARKLEDFNKEKEEAARKAAEKLVELQEEAAVKAFEQQRKLLEMQAELGRKASEANRLEAEKTRKRDKVISSLSVYQTDEDVEEFLLAQERKLGLGGIPESEWLTLIAPKLTGGLGTSWQELCDEGLDYWAVRTALLKGCGYTPGLAGEAYYAFRQEQLKGMAGEQVFKKGAQLLKRMVAPLVLEKAAIFKIVKPWVYACVGRRARAVLEAREIEDAEALARGLQDFLSHEGEKVPGKAAVFGGAHPSEKRQFYHSDSERERGVAGTAGGHNGSSMKCFRCGKVGHKAVDCWQGGAGKQEEASISKIICYICGVEGHKATTCPGKKEAQKGANVKLIQQVRLSKEYDTVIEGKVDGWGVSLVLDSGAHITIVPEDMVAERRKTGEYVELKGYQATTSIMVPTAKVKFEVEGMAEWEEVVALAPPEEGRENEVILRLGLKSSRGRTLVELANRLGEAEAGVGGMSEKESDSGQKEKFRIGVVTVVKSVEKETVKAPVRRPVKEVRPLLEGLGAARAADRAADAARIRRLVRVAGFKPSSIGKKASVRAPVRRPVAGGAKAVEAARPKVQKAQKKGAVGGSLKGELKPSPISLEVLEVDKILGTGDGGLTADRPVRNPEPVASDESSKKDEWPDWSGSADSCVEKAEVVERSCSLKPVKALEVVLRASALEQARFGKIKRKMKWGRVESDGLGERAEEERVTNSCIMKTSMSSKPAPSAVCWTVEGPEAFTGRKVRGDIYVYLLYPPRTRTSILKIHHRRLEEG